MPDADRYSILPGILRFRDALRETNDAVDAVTAAAAQDLAEAIIGMPDAGERRAIQEERGGTAQPAAAPTDDEKLRLGVAARSAPVAAPAAEMPF